MLQVLEKDLRARSTEKRASSRKVGRQEVVLADCETALSAMKPGSFDVVVTSPPYNIGVAYRSYEDRKPRQVYLDWLGRIAIEISRVMKDDASFFLNVGSTNSDPWIAIDVANVFREILVLQNHFQWVKSISIGDDSVGHFKPIAGKRFLNNNYESIFHFTKSGSVQLDRLAIGVPFKDKTNIARWGHDRDKRCAGNVWFIPYKTVRSKAQKFDHPAGFPVELPERCIRLHGKDNVSILDPFLGAGSTLVAAQRLGCAGVGIEIDQHYADTAVERLLTT
jgi:site-specific DNA-methyltransferase (adenine-specific)